MSIINSKNNPESDNFRVVVLGAGPAGLGAAYRLTQATGFEVTVLEQNDRVGGNAGSFELAGIPVDFGSHRLHPSCNPIVLDDIQRLLGADLLDRPRHGRIRLRGRWIHFPLKPLDLATRLPPGFILGVVRDMAGKLFSGSSHRDRAETFASVMEQGLGRTICHDFYFPYAEKIWGLEPEALAVTQAKRRVSNNSLGKMLGKVLSAVPGLKPKGAGRFFYPYLGFGQISNAYCEAAANAGAEILLNARVTSVEKLAGGGFNVHFDREGSEQSLFADYVWSTIPINILARIMDPSPPESYILDAQNIEYRAMILVYLVIEQDHFSEYDAHYFPEAKVKISRLSETKNYSGRSEPAKRTVICAELPCSPNDLEWSLSDHELGDLVRDSLQTAGIPVQSPVSAVFVRRLRHAYPIYKQGFETHFQQLDEWIGNIDGLLTFGRQGLFAHDNTHHALYMAYSAVNCLDERGNFDDDRWEEYRKEFETHVVED